MSSQNTIRVLAAEDVRRALPMPDAIEAMQEAFVELSAGRTVMPVRTSVKLADNKGEALVMPSYAKRLGNLALKTVTLMPGNPEQGLPFIQGMVCVFCGETGAPRAMLDGMTLTALRTGAASGLATRLLARENAAKVAVFGAGVQARTQLAAVCAVRKIEQALVFDPNMDKAEAFAQEAHNEQGVLVEAAATPQAALADADVICTATIAQQPVFADADIKPGAHINAVGSYLPHVQEIPTETVLRSRLVVDHRESALIETGDLIIPIQLGLLTAAELHGELGELAAGKIEGRANDEELTLFKSVGVAVQDLAAATYAFKRAEALDLGTSVPF